MSSLKVDVDTWVSSLKPETGKAYGRYLHRLLKDQNPQTVVDTIKSESRTNCFDTYVQILSSANTFTSSGLHLASYAFRKFLFDQGVQILPRVRLPKQERVTPSVDLSWKDALAICGAASKPYNLILKLMLHSAWGSRQWCEFNSPEQWMHIRAVLADSQVMYVKVKFPHRKSNNHEGYSLVPRELLEETIAAVPVPVTTSSGMPLDMAHYLNARVYLEKAFNTAVHRAAISPLQGKPRLHELRDCFKTQATIQGCAREVSEFAMLHTVDPLSYDKCYHNEVFVWENLQKIYGPTPARITEVSDETKYLRREVELLRVQVQSLQMGRHYSEVDDQ